MIGFGQYSAIHFQIAVAAAQHLLAFVHAGGFFLRVPLAAGMVQHGQFFGAQQDIAGGTSLFSEPFFGTGGRGEDVHLVGRVGNKRECFRRKYFAALCAANAGNAFFQAVCRLSDLGFSGGVKRFFDGFGGENVAAGCAPLCQQTFLRTGRILLLLPFAGCMAFGRGTFPGAAMPPQNWHRERCMPGASQLGMDTSSKMPL